MERASERFSIPAVINKLKSLLASLYDKAICAITPCCHEMTHLISESQERPLGSFLRLRMRLHYGVCIWCLRYRDQIVLIRKLLRQFPGFAEDGEAMLSESAKERIKDSLRETRD